MSDLAKVKKPNLAKITSFRTDFLIFKAKKAFIIYEKLLQKY